MDVELRRLLVETAFVGAGHGLHQEAETILKALELNECQPLPIAIGRVLTLISQNRLDEAGKTLVPFISETEGACEADAFMALVNLKQGQFRSAEFYLQRCERAGGTLAEMASHLRQDFKGGGGPYGF
ncbi:hypothetical protein [Endozoicomonas sp. Mp262]|uniref:YscG family type III secretion protein n=1 Tax=Endozoicomonas sp. Mp262 TaxID=2919499 RepID=UPI0021D8EAB4